MRRALIVATVIGAAACAAPSAAYGIPIDGFAGADATQPQDVQSGPEAAIGAYGIPPQDAGAE